MNSLGLQEKINQLEEVYPILAKKFMSRPDPKGRIIIPQAKLVDLFNSAPKQEVLFPFFDSMTLTHLRKALAQKDVQFAEYSSIVNQRMDLAELVLMHHKKSFPEKDYEDNMAFFEERRGGYLKQIAADKESSAPNWTEYGYFLLGLHDKIKDSDPVKAGQFKQQAEQQFRKAHDAGYIEATEALAVFLYSETGQTDKAIKLWEKAAAAGNKTALKNLLEVLCADDSLKPREREVSLAKADGDLLKGIFNNLTSNEEELVKLVSSAIALQEEKSNKQGLGTPALAA